LKYVLEQLFELKNGFEDLTKPREYPDSKFLTNKDIKQILKWLPSDLTQKKIVKLFSSSVDGKNSVQAVTSRISGKANTIHVYKATNGKIFGGFINAIPSMYTNYFTSNGAFMFNLTDGIKADGKFGAQHGWWDVSTWAFCFGGDMYLNLTNYIGFTNPNPTAYHYANADVLSGGNNWTCEEYEIYTLE